TGRFGIIRQGVPISITVPFKYCMRYLIMQSEIHGPFKVPRDSLNGLSMLITRSASKSAQQSHDIGYVGSGTISGIPKTANDA
ncbi:hypothetical protein A2U01_0090191, partial [Trifolium medium]|nr:hypothetical protein [Trifolium medium]